MHAAIPPNSDDYHGCHAGRTSSRSRHRHGLGVAAAIGNHDRGRTDSESSPDAVHHSSCLSLSGSSALAATWPATNPPASLASWKPSRLERDTFPKPYVTITPVTCV